MSKEKKRIKLEKCFIMLDSKGGCANRVNKCSLVNIQVYNVIQLYTVKMRIHSTESPSV